LGRSAGGDISGRAIAGFSARYAGQGERDYRDFAAAVESDRPHRTLWPVTRSAPLRDLLRASL
jgi:hypothetical protein